MSGHSRTAGSEGRVRVLFLAYYFPPLGGAGSQRTLKFAKYLPEHGFDVSVVSGSLGGEDRWAPADRAMCREIDARTKVSRVNIYERPMRSQRLSRIMENLGHRSEFGHRWKLSAIEAGRRTCEELRPEIIVATMSPFETAEVASQLSQEFDIPWIADLRDPWVLDEWQVYPSRWHRAIRLRRMRQSLASASSVIMNTPEAAVRVRSAFPTLEPRVIHITNGYDAEDFELPVSGEGSNLFRIVHSGALHTMAGLRQKRLKLVYDLLGRTQPGVELLGRSHYYLLKALETWIQEDPGIRDKVRLDLVGTPSEGDLKIAEGSKVSGMVNFFGYLSHYDSLAKVREASLLFLPMHGIDSGAKATIVPGKTYEYMATGRPVLGAVPKGDCRDMLEAVGNCHTCAPNDVEGILKAIKVEYAKWLNGDSVSGRNWEMVGRFERRILTHELVRELNRVRDQRYVSQSVMTEDAEPSVGEDKNFEFSPSCITLNSWNWRQGSRNI
ncbi:glycosyltransferase [Haloferula sp.]|uniref:glycosyltransferase n=1 Tax=Haloferula sp. TaxID=2497595 RepID=UPI003C7458D0